MPHNLTWLEQRALPSVSNLSDGHARQSLTEAQREIVDGLAALFAQVMRESYDKVLQRSVNSYMRCVGQYTALVDGPVRTIPFYSSSCAIDSLARCLMQRGPRIGLTHPTFDNIPDLLRARGANLRPVLDVSTVDPSQYDSLFIVSPNNPTGTYMSAAEMEGLATRCRATDCFLAIDASFRGFVSGACFDGYEILESVGVEYAVVEDTGKLWPTLELKVGFLAYGKRTTLDFERAASDLLLSVSPVVLELVTRFSNDAAAGGLSALRSLIARNRESVRNCLAAQDLVDAFPSSEVSVSLLKLPGGVAGTDVARRWASVGVHALPGRPFYWAEPDLGEPFVRIALSRDPATLDGALIIASALQLFDHT